jgi:mannitol PTS system EIIA component
MVILTPAKVKINAVVTDKLDAIKQVGEMLVQGGHVPVEYIDKMIEREAILSTDLGSGLAMPHGTNESKALIKSTGIAVLTVPGGVDFGGEEPVKLIIGLAALGQDHIDILSNIALLVSEDNAMERVLAETSPDRLVELIVGGL